MMFKSWARQWGAKIGREAADKAIAEALAGDDLTKAIERTFDRIMLENDGSVTKAGFILTGAAMIRRHWPNMPHDRAKAEFSDYVFGFDNFGSPGSDWSAKAAKELAVEYMREFGE